MLLVLIICLAMFQTTRAFDDVDGSPSSDKFLCEYELLVKLIELEEKTSQQEATLAALTRTLQEARDQIIHLNNTVTENKGSSGGSSGGSTYVRWGRTTCPGDAQLVYKGHVGGTHYTHSGSGANPLCLPTDPIFDKYQAGFQTSGRIYGAEYQTSTYSAWKYLHDNDIPCAVCQIRRSNVLMVPARNLCYEGYVLEYKGYLMAGYYSHSSSEYICVDEKPETASGGQANADGKLFYFVESACGSLECPPYANGMELTCAVCSFKPVFDSSGLQPYA